MSATPSDPRIGRLVAGKYRVTRLIGMGGMGSVYEAENVSLGKRVALKFLHVTERDDETTRARFQREARAISAVQSTHIVQVFDWGRDEGSPDASGAAPPFLVMELLDGRDLAQRIERLGRLPLPEALRLTVEALRGLRRVHAAGIVHRDLKPENLFLVTGDDEQLHVKIVDFGLSKLTEGTPLDGPEFGQSAKLTQAGVVVGTPLYMAPEQVEGLVEVDRRADLWAMGAILYEMLAGRPPFVDRSYARLVMAICQRDPEDLTRLNPAVTPAVARVVAAALTRDRERRLPSAEAFLAALAEAAPEDVQASGARASVFAGAAAVSKTVPADSASDDSPLDPTGGTAPIGGASAVVPPSSRERERQGAPAEEAGALDATIAAQTRGAVTAWLTDAPLIALWRGEVDAPDRLRIETRDGGVRDLRLEPVGEITLGRVAQVGGETNDLVYADVASRLAARLRHDGTRWWLERRPECSVPVQVGTRPLGRGERAPLVHGTFVSVGAMRATMVDRRYVSHAVPAGAIDPLSGLLARGGLEQEVAGALQHRDPHDLLLVLVAPEGASEGRPASVMAAQALHRLWPSRAVAREGDVVAVVLRGEEAASRVRADQALEVLAEARVRVVASGLWSLRGDVAEAGSELERALDALDAAAGPHASAGGVVALREAAPAPTLSEPERVVERARSPKHQGLLFAIEDQAALGRIGSRVVGGLEQELAAVIQTMVGPSALVTRLAPGVIGASLPRRLDVAQIGVGVQCEWHGRPAVSDGKVDLPRTLAWEQARPERMRARAEELARECADPQGVLGALSGGLPHPIAGRVHAALGAASAVERVKMLFDVLEGAWRLLAIVLAAAHFGGGEGAPSSELWAAWRAFYARVGTRSGLPLGTWRQLARLCSRGLAERRASLGAPAGDPVLALAGDLLDETITPNETFDTLSNLLHAERNQFAHRHYGEARAAQDVEAFERMTRRFLRALRPLAGWTLVTVERTEPDLYGESQTVEFIDHTGAHVTGARRRIGFNSAQRLAHVVYLVKWREGLVLPLEPWMRRMATGDRFDLCWMDHLPRAGTCRMSAVVSGATTEATVDAGRLPPLLWRLVEETS